MQLPDCAPAPVRAPHAPTVPMPDHYSGGSAHVAVPSDNSAPNVERVLTAPAGATQVNQDRQLLPEIWRAVENLSGSSFTLDACCDVEGKNSFCNKFCAPTPDKDFFATVLAGEHVWMNSPFTGLRTFVARYLQQKSESPQNTSACILVPCRPRDNVVHNMLQHTQVLAEYPAGSVLFTAPDKDGKRHSMPPCPFGVKVYYDPPRSPILHRGFVSTASTGPPSSLTMLFEGSGSQTNLLLCCSTPVLQLVS